MGALLRVVGLPLLRVNRLSRLPSDALAGEAAQIMQKWDAQTQRLNADLYLPDEATPGAGRLMHAFRLVCEVEPLVAKIKSAQKSGQIGAGETDAMTQEAVAAGVLSEAEAARVDEARSERLAAIEVDVFTPEEFFGKGAVPEKESRQQAA
jgi:acyl-CoA dehydrogenase